MHSFSSMHGSRRAQATTQANLYTHFIQFFRISLQVNIKTFTLLGECIKVRLEGHFQVVVKKEKYLARFDDLDHQNQNFMVSKMLVNIV